MIGAIIPTALGDFNVTSKFIGERLGFPFDKRDQNYHNHFKISITTPGGGKVKGDFYGSAHDYDEGKQEFDKGDLISVLHTFADDVISGSYDYNEFLSEFGYEDNPQTRKIWNKLGKVLDDWIRAGVTLEQLYELVNDLRERYPDAM